MEKTWVNALQCILDFIPVISQWLQIGCVTLRFGKFTKGSFTSFINNSSWVPLIRNKPCKCCLVKSSLFARNLSKYGQLHFITPTHYVLCFRCVVLIKKDKKITVRNMEQFPLRARDCDVVSDVLIGWEQIRPRLLLIFTHGKVWLQKN